uniref:Signal transducer and activator of transcription n=1 Tax=Scleropages formosus TaxID=113540 RepID=A0A8C9TE43_SCLFO
MSQWHQVQQLQGRLLEQVSGLYDDNFPMEIRHTFAPWIESQDWDTAMGHESMAAVLLSILLSQVDDCCSQEQNFLQKHSLKRIHQQLQGKFQANPLHMAGVIADCLREERRILSSASFLEQEPTEESMESFASSESHRNMDARVSAIRGRVQVIDQMVKDLEHMQEDFEYRYKTLKSYSPSASTDEFVKREVETFNYILKVLDFKRKEILTTVGEVITEVDMLMGSQLEPELKAWKRRQQIACIGGPELTSVDQLQCWFTLTVQSLFLIKRQLDKLEQLFLIVTYETDPIPQQKPLLEDHMKRLISHLVKMSFVVEKQPCTLNYPHKPLVIKTGIYFSTRLRLLLKLPEVDYQLKVKTAFDKHRQFEILNNNPKQMDIDESSNGCLAVEFRHLQLKDKKGSSTSKNEGSLTVTEDLHILTFQARLCLQGLSIDLETSTLPLVVISNIIQLPAGWASVMWYNLLTDEPKNLSFFNNPPCANWSQLAKMLSWQFSTITGRSLTTEQLEMLGEKLLGEETTLVYESQVYWSRFCKENIPGKTFSFWLWLDSILELIKKCLQPVWIDGCILGFVSKARERALLKDKAPGTFLLRFSESHLGGITFTWVEQDYNGEKSFSSVEPYTKNHLNMLPFADIIRDYKVLTDGNVPESPLKFLYPDIPKDKAFGKHYNRLHTKGKLLCPIRLSAASPQTPPKIPLFDLPFSPNPSDLEETFDPQILEEILYSISVPNSLNAT